MGTAVLRPHDCLKHRLHLDFLDSRPPPSPLMNPPSRKRLSRSSQPKRSKPTLHRPNPARSNRRLGSPDKENSVQPEPRKQPPLVMGRVTILRRGDELKPMIPSPPPVSVDAADLRSEGDDSSVLCSTDRMGPDPEILPKLSDLKAVYAGPAFISSPSPSSVPIPAFFLKKSATEASKSEIATRGLRCLLRLDVVA